MQFTAAPTPPRSLCLMFWHEVLARRAANEDVRRQTVTGPTSLVTHASVCSTRKDSMVLFFTRQLLLPGTMDGSWFWSEESFGMCHHLCYTKLGFCWHHHGLLPRKRPCMLFLSMRVSQCHWNLTGGLLLLVFLHLKHVFGRAIVTGTNSGKHMTTASNKMYFINILWVISKTQLEIWKNLFLFKYNKWNRLELCKDCLIIFLFISMHVLMINTKHNFMQVVMEKNECRREIKERNLKH